ncbi:DMT family transporter [Sedimentitalea sp. JM2-8]|uniref:DMT family transporter n=1 Tax=Sedimentitalea xiamensis TaxID=3050037 RepID=A0ABT7FIT2_9RHOB|nr:DMT family transporter [Sedimentitalea xiamensis]MDK3075039.1 DMT family transporter [Sedimentitalea xiamensis]
MNKNLTSHRPGLAVILKISAIFLFTIMSAIIKATSDAVPPGEAVFFRSFFAIPVILVWLALRGQLRNGLLTRNPAGHFWRGILGTTGMGLTFAGLGLLPLPEVTAIGYATPIFTVILAALLLGERIRMIRITAVLLGLIGVLIMLWPRLGSGAVQDGATLGAMLVLGATVTRAFVQIHIRKMVQTENTAAIVFYFSATASLISLMTMPFGWTFPAPDVAILLILAGLIGGVAQILVTSSYRFGPASMLAPYDYSSMIFAILVGYVWFSELPTVIMLTGAALVIAGNILVIWREHQLGLKRGKARSVTDPKS